MRGGRGKGGLPPSASALRPDSPPRAFSGQGEACDSSGRGARG
jgi:hypothetical protein